MWANVKKKKKEHYVFVALKTWEGLSSRTFQDKVALEGWVWERVVKAERKLIVCPMWQNINQILQRSTWDRWKQEERGRGSPRRTAALSEEWPNEGVAPNGGEMAWTRGRPRTTPHPHLHAPQPASSPGTQTSWVRESTTSYSNRLGLCLYCERLIERKVSVLCTDWTIVFSVSVALLLAILGIPRAACWSPWKFHLESL